MTGARNLMHVQEILMGPYPVESESITIEFLFCFIFFSTERKVKKLNKIWLNCGYNLNRYMFICSISKIALNCYNQYSFFFFYLHIPEINNVLTFHVACIGNKPQFINSCMYMYVQYSWTKEKKSMIYGAIRHTVCYFSFVQEYCICI